jgi:hypothetical protein
LLPEPKRRYPLREFSYFLGIPPWMPGVPETRLRHLPSASARRELS